MKSIQIEQATLDGCVADAQSEHVVLTRKGSPVALVIGVEGLDEEQIDLGSSQEFWQWIAQRRAQKTIRREDIERTLKD
jgi:antitoxin (DNA-binding transcriptional repressor) of toxin-antitoxin stability system